MIKTTDEVIEKFTTTNRINTIEQVREKLNRAVNLLDAISFRESTTFKTYKLLHKVENFLFRLSYSVITNNEGVLVL